MTNRKKFIEVFGIEPDIHFCPISEDIPCKECIYNQKCKTNPEIRFWNEEYKEEEEE